MTTDDPIRVAGQQQDEKRVVFPDVGLHIAVLGALLEAGDVDAERIASKLANIEGEDDSERLYAAMKRLHAIKLSREALARLHALDFDGGNEVYMLMEEGAGVETGGEDDSYALRSLAGFDALPSLRRLDLDGHGYREETLDLRPLEGHPALEWLSLTGKCSHVAALESLPRLRHVDVRYGSVDDGAVLERLAARGVEVVR